MYGSLDLADTNIVQPLSLLPDRYQEIISEAGGLKHFLLQCGLFVVDGNVVMLKEECLFNDVVEKLRPFNCGGDFEQMTYPLTREHPRNLRKLPNSESVGADQEETMLSPRKGNSPVLNRDATEFIPQSVSPENTEFLEKNVGDVSETVCASEVNVQDKVVSNGDIDHGSNTANSKEAFDSHPLQDYCKMFGQDNTAFTAVGVHNFEVDPLDTKTSGSNGNSLNGEELPSFEPGAAKVEKSVDRNSSDLKGKPSHVSKSSGNVVDSNEGKENAENGKENSGAVQVTTKLSNGKTSGSGSDMSVSFKTKAVQTQPMVKNKGVMTDPQQEQYKVDYNKVVSERDALQARVKELADGHTLQQKVNSQEVERVKKRLRDTQRDKEVCALTACF